jgi:rod shape-determining protein MreD
MFDPGVSKFQFFCKQLIPLGCIFLAVILDRASALDFLPVQPLLSFPTVYYWALYRPDWVSLVGLMGLGIMDDSLSGAYLGQNTMLFLLIYAVVLKQMDYFMTAGFLRTWWAFSLIMGLCGGIQWGFSALLCAQPINVLGLFIPNAATALVFPFVYSLLNRIAAYTYDWE